MDGFHPSGLEKTVMKKGLFLFCIFFVPALYSQWEWSKPILICRGVAPDMDFDRKTGRLHIVSMFTGAVYTQMDSLGTILRQEVVPGSEGDFGGWTFGAAIAVDKNGNAHVCYRNSDVFYFNLFYTHQSGQDWSRPLQLAYNVYRGYMVRMAIDGSDWVHVVRTIPQSDLEGKLSYMRIINDRIDKQLDWIQDYHGELRLEIDATPYGFLHVVAGCPIANNGSVTYYRSEDGGYSLNSYGDIHAGTCTGRNESADVFADRVGDIHICYGSQRDEDVGNKPSIRYVRFKEKQKVRDLAVTKEGDIFPWLGGEGWGICSIAATDSGECVMIAFMNKDVGDLYTVFSTDGGTTWSNPVKMAGSVDSRPNGRTRPMLRAYRNHFYLLYSQTSDTLREDYRLCQLNLLMLRNYGDYQPEAGPGGPYSGLEGHALELDASPSTDRGLNPGITRYQWDINDDGNYEVSTSSPKVLYVFPDDYQGKLVLKVEDRIGLIDTSQVIASIANVPPQADAGSDRICKEGDPVEFSAQASDVQLDTLTYVWSFGDNQIGVGQKTSHSFKNQGAYKTILIVMDEDGGQTRDSLHVTVLNAPPVAEAGGPYVFPISESVQFNGSATDPGILDVLSYAWDLNGDGVFETSGQKVSKKYVSLGRNTVWLSVSDGDGDTGLDSASVLIVRDNPVIGKIPYQEISEGKSFKPIALDDWVEDPFYKDAELTWTYRGNSRLKAALKGREFTVAVPDSEWSGSEIITFLATNPKNASDSIQVVFTVNSVNDPPRWIKPAPNYAFGEDSTLTLPLDSLRVRVGDIDNLTSELVFSVTGNRFVHSVYDAKMNALVLSADLNWNGIEELSFVVADKGGLSASSRSRITVRPVPDSPAPFVLRYPVSMVKDAWPDTIRFRWQRINDNDNPGGMVYYEWILADQNNLQVPLLKKMVFDTTFVYTTDKTLSKNVYYWWVSGFTGSGASITSSNVGFVSIGMTDVEDVQTAEAVPTEFRLMQNYPNPFSAGGGSAFGGNPETRVTYHLPAEGRVRLSVFNPLGEEVRVLEDGDKRAGVYRVVWDGRDCRGLKMPSGVYVCRFQSGTKVLFKKMMLMQ
jgi:chitodextrinase